MGIIKDKQIRKNFLYKEVSKTLLKFFISNKKIPLKVRYSLNVLCFKNISNFDSANKRCNFCVYTLRSKSVLRIFRCSKIIFRKRVDCFFGILKASW
uniref:Ribosomal protein S14 n=1 Tax=Aureoumbra lagunensis TaxID=44058 RepID=A0A7U0QFX3_9STRA|nr:ribosomal protein S14 [Aureoumbra lagunensis]QQW50411.1 ribosomal protein S14 [Aureoumbra lagunensis]